ncbi:MAG: deaminase [Candidatus Marinimicrobia bacterium]|jgi:dCMP deaminase|nr:deaminase [Candidatus Neomarinimicrobiota bacterium]MDD5710216.1 deaminase [Candidatus Neomarinimicrobiota bacterium]MDX9777631.1 deaminase [bacterium]
MKRPDWDNYFLNIAKVVATRSSCLRRQVGAVIVHDKDIISTGYNGAPQFQPNCLEIGFCYRDKHNIKSGTQLERCRAVGSHAESNAIALAARNGHATSDSTIYIYGHDFVCYQCRAQIANANIRRVILEHPGGDIEEWIPERDWIVHPVDKENCEC